MRRSLRCFASTVSRLVTFLISTDLIASHCISCHFISVDFISSHLTSAVRELCLLMPFVFLSYHRFFHFSSIFLFDLTSCHLSSSHLALPEPISSQFISCHLIFSEINLPSFHLPWHFACSSRASSSHVKIFYLSFFLTLASQSLFHPNKTPQQLFPVDKKIHLQIYTHTHIYIHNIEVPSPWCPHPNHMPRARFYFLMFPCAGRKTSLFVFKMFKHAANYANSACSLCGYNGLVKLWGRLEDIHDYNKNK